jgi:hypothetical protein
MREIIQLLLEHPILAVFLLFWLFSVLGGMATRAARRAQQGQPQAGPRAPAQPPARDLVLEFERWRDQHLRRMGRQAEARAEPDHEPAARREEPTEGDQPRRLWRPKPGYAVSTLGSRAAAREEAGEGDRSFYASPHVGQLHQELAQRQRAQASLHPGRRDAKGRRGRSIDLSDPASAIVALEVLGPPRALRDLEAR